MKTELFPIGSNSRQINHFPVSSISSNTHTHTHSVVMMRGSEVFVSANIVVLASNLIPGENGLWLALSATGNLDVLARLHRQVPWSICENRRY